MYYRCRLNDETAVKHFIPCRFREYARATNRWGSIPANTICQFSSAKPAPRGGRETRDAGSSRNDGVQKRIRSTGQTRIDGIEGMVSKLVRISRQQKIVLFSGLSLRAKTFGNHRSIDTRRLVELVAFRQRRSQATASSELKLHGVRATARPILRVCFQRIASRENGSLANENS